MKSLGGDSEGDDKWKGGWEVGGQMSKDFQERDKRGIVRKNRIGECVCFWGKT